MLKYAANAGTLTTGTNSVIKGIKIVNAATDDSTDIKIIGVTVTNATSVSDGSLATPTGGTFEADSSDATINKSTSATIGST